MHKLSLRGVPKERRSNLDSQSKIATPARKTGRLAMTAFILFSIINSPVFSAPAALPLAAAPDPARIGVVSAVKGVVKLGRPGKVGEIVKSGHPIYLGDEVSTDEKSNLQILLLDETVFTIGPASSIVIDKFVYDPASQTGQINARVVKGAFRFVTGKIARKKPSDMKVDLPTGTIGVRGTIVAGQSEGNRSLIVLMGPGAKNNTPARIGQITIGNEVGGEMKQVTVTRPGFGSVIEGPGALPSEPFQVPAEELAKMTSALEPAPGSEDDKDGETGEDSDPASDSGQDTAAAGDLVEAEGALNDLFADANKETAAAAQEEQEDEAGFEDGITTLEDLDLVTEGSFHYADKSVPLTGGLSGSTYDFDIDIDFGDRTIGGTGANNRITANIVTGSTPHTPEYLLGEMDFDDASGDSAIFSYINISNTDSAGCPNCGPADVVITLVNSEDIVANQAAHTIEFQDGTGMPIDYDGAGLSEPRT